MHASQTREAATPAVVGHLVALSEGDLPYSDRYLDRAAARLDPLCSRERFFSLKNDQTALGSVTIGREYKPSQTRRRPCVAG